MEKKIARVLAFYLPQYHPILENDIWWGKGFTEWTNVGKARPLFKGHYQPHVPADLGYYDLRVPEVREQQVEMARYAGIEGFVYYHYWFAGKRLLERPFNEVLNWGKPDFPFCLAWANETWSGIWHGDANRILIEQTYPGRADFEKHFYTVLPAFLDKRYIRVANKPLFFIYRPFQLPNPKEFICYWNDLAIKNGLEGIHFVANTYSAEQTVQALEVGFDAVNTYWLKKAMSEISLVQTYWNSISSKFLKGLFKSPVYKYDKMMDFFSDELDANPDYYPTVLTGWDNSPRSGHRGLILKGYTPQTFANHLKKVIEKVEQKPEEKRIIFMKSWNEWAEGNYVEPDLKFGWKFLDVLRDTLIQNVAR